ncbi:guanylate-binding protein 1-like isoform X2 [Hemicordylus capensis]|nr:guanylate-binding protein 1-like isoform X2 [Hemicordylus capensis]XP_053123867.1 guanylate-binding protein 1-like isoform X2 [Hemicordylus capensis]XP_053123868.1 guanylate-binding protein 1-like isoform X2 [Hemicordylus capensis]XP_053123869.1 guanylate-binding protein 1-like isoform X2 [Hemicordylus capensis]XP_053123870.1 guanylate-binding protein 1-like isoform X2 [Hemicordylus capensis]
MEEPLCLIENNPNEELKINQEALSVLQSIQQPVVVVAIVGLYRTGKSYILNKLAGKNKGFSLGSTIQANTMGIWMWCLPHPQKKGHTLVLLDTEGLGDVEKSNTENDSWIFALSILLSSTFIYNSMGTIDQFALEKLQYVTELTKHIKVKSSSGEGSSVEEKEEDFIRFFPAFIWAVRDFSLQLKLNGRSISSDEYLENALRRKQGQPEKLDLAKKCIRQYFASRKCFVFDRPASRRDLEELEDLSESLLSRDFVVQMSRFRTHIYESAQVKEIQGGHRVTGELLGHLARCYVDAITSGAIPCIENAVVALAQIENTAAVCDAMTHYEAKIKQLELPTEAVEELLQVHAQCEKEAIQVFMARAFKDENQTFQKQLGYQLQAKLLDLCSCNEKASSDRCQAVLTELFQDLEEELNKGSYSVAGGYQKFLDDQGEKVEQYHLVPGKGLMASKVLQDFLKSKESTTQSILKADRSLTEQQKLLEVEQERAKASAREAELQKKLKEETEKMAQEKERSYKEHESQLMAQMERERTCLMAEHERVLKSKLEEQARLQREGFQQEVAVLHNEIQNLRHQMNQPKRCSRCVIA